MKPIPELFEDHLDKVAYPMYCGPSTSHDRFVAGEVVTHCQFIHDTSEWVIHPMHRKRLRRLFRMLIATYPKHACEDCPAACPGWSPTINSPWIVGAAAESGATDA